MEPKNGNFIGFSISAMGDESFRAFVPSKNEYLSEEFIQANDHEFEHALSLSKKAFPIYSALPYEKRAVFLDSIADEIMAIGDILIERCSLESGLPIGRITGERARTCGQLKMFARLLREGSWLDLRIDTAQPDRQPVTKPDCRRMLMPIGPVAVFGASNFPLAFSTAGGDTASALASGCTVIVKSHPSHPGTNALVSSAIIKAAKNSGMPDGVFSSLNLSNEYSVKLVEHPTVKAVGFTGSRHVGMALFNAAVNRPDPIQVFAEMSSVNPVILMENALRNHHSNIAGALVKSVTLGVGQFCTNPGLVFLVESDVSRAFMEEFSLEYKNSLPGTMLNSHIHTSYYENIQSMKNDHKIHLVSTSSQPADSVKTEGQPIAFSVTASDFLSDKSLFNEVFGPETLFVISKNTAQQLEVLESLPGQLTATIHADQEDEGYLSSVIRSITQKAGRIIYGGYPTGVEVCHSMQHGGPFPATTFPNSTSVGTAAILRFTRPVAFQDFPDHLLPDALKNNNPLTILRLVDGVRTTKKILPVTDPGHSAR